jgi:hypothetical protein
MPIRGRAMAQAISLRPFTTETRIRARVSSCVICGGQSGTWTGFSVISSFFSLSVSIHRGCTYLGLIWGMNNRTVGGRSSDTVSPHRDERQQWVFGVVKFRNTGSPRFSDTHHSDGVLRGFQGIHLADRYILTRLE